jgi:hypothetical protein
MEKCDVFVLEAGEKAEWTISCRRDEDQVYHTNVEPVHFNQFWIDDH